MKPLVTKKPRAEQDLISHFAFIARDKVAPAERFLKVAEQSFQRLAEMPGLGRAWQSPQAHLAGIRVYPMPSGFRNYLIFYRELKVGIEVLAVLHGARDLEAVLDTLPID